MAKKGNFDYILLETTGLADPGNLAPLFWVDEGLASTIYLDGIVTLVDAKNILKSLDDPAGKVDGHDEHDHHGPIMTTAHVQISHADVIVVNKTDLVSEEELQAVQERIKSINGLAKIHLTKESAVPKLEGYLLDLHAYDNVAELDNSKGHSHLDPVRVGPIPTPLMPGSITDGLQTISTISIPLPLLGANQVARVDKWLRSVLWENELPNDSDEHKAPFEIHRLKGRLAVENGDVKVVQGVRELFEIFDSPASRDQESEGASQTGKIVLIGRHVTEFDFERSLLESIK